VAIDDLDRYGVADLARAVIKKAASLPWAPPAAANRSAGL
jgi:hypothetical protein